MEERSVYTLQLILTKQCNLGCRYCYVIPKEEVMELETAQSAVMNAVERADGLDADLDICFMGGEPLTAFARMREICEWTWQAYKGRGIAFSSPTNGTLLTEEMRAWFRKYRDRITLALSYDGAGSQNENRSNSDSMIDGQFFHELWPCQPWKMTISERNVPGLAENIIRLQEKGILLGANCACGEPAWSGESVREFGRQMFLLVSYYLDHPEAAVCDLLDINFLSVFAERSPMLRRCGLGHNYITVDCSGEEYACHMFSPLALPEGRAALAKSYGFENRTDFTVPECGECILNQACPKCYGMSYKRTGTPFRADPNLCAAFKQQARAACSYQIKRQAGKKEQSAEDRMILAAIKKIIKPI